MAVPVVTPATIEAAIRSSAPGSAFKLEGTFGNIPMKAAATATGLGRKANLVLDCEKAVITGELRTGGVDGLTLYGGLWTGPAPINLGGENRGITIEGARFHGPATPAGDAIKLVNVRGLRVRDVVADRYNNGLAISKVEDADIQDVLFTRLRKDMIQAAGVTGLRVRRMVGRDGRPVADDHPDGIQIRNLPGEWAPSSDIVIEDVWLEGPIQGVVTTHKPGDGGFDRITLRRARIVGGHPNGAGFLSVRGLTIEDVDVSTLAGVPHQSRVFWDAACTDVRLAGAVQHAAYKGNPAVVWSKPAGADPAELAEAKASIASLQDINARLAAQRDTYLASARDGVGRLNQIAELARVLPLT